MQVRDNHFLVDVSFCLIPVLGAKIQRRIARKKSSWPPSRFLDKKYVQHYDGCFLPVATLSILNSSYFAELVFEVVPPAPEVVAWDSTPLVARVGCFSSVLLQTRDANPDTRALVGAAAENYLQVVRK